MTSFFEKLKKGMGIEAVEGEIEEEQEEQEEKKAEEKPKKKKVIRAKKIAAEPEPPEVKVVEELESEKTEIKEEVPVEKPAAETKEKWPEPEGQLAIDVYQTENDLVIQSAIAGVKPEDLDISIEKDIITIRGNRQKPFEEEGDYFTQECYWGPFSREMLLPVEVDPERAEAGMKDGILTIRIPKILREKLRKIKVRT